MACPVETSDSQRAVADYLSRRGWRLAQSIDLGTSAHILVVEDGNERHALKIQRDQSSDVRALRTEYQVLQYLSRTAMRQYVPGVGAWLPELGGFLMEVLRYPTPAERDAQAWAPDLAHALQTLHRLTLPAVTGLADDRPDISAAVSRRFRHMFELVQKGAGYWARLPGADKARLGAVRAHYATYVGLLPQMEGLLAGARPALTHGDLAGDNLMLTQEGRLALVDWGAARISAAWTDVAHLLTYANWSPDQEHRFLRAYFGDDAAALEGAWPCIQALCRLYRYHSCVLSLVWLNGAGEGGLDAVGRAHFERMLRAL